MSDFIEQIAQCVIKHADEYGIKVHSPIIAQAILESASGTSELAVKAHNYFGLKYRANRCKTTEFYLKVGSEQNPNGSYVSSTMKWFKFRTMEDGVIGYFDFINIPNYANLKGITDPRKYLETIKADKYCTSLKYVENNMAVIKKYGLTKYDNVTSGTVVTESKKEGVNKMSTKKMTFNIHGGHNPKGKVACGAVGLIDESEQDRIIKNKVMEYLRAEGHTVYDCTVDNGVSQSDVLKKIVAKCNAHVVDLDVSIHFNSGAKDKKGNGKSCGVEVWVYSKDSKSYAAATRIVNNVSAVGLENRGVKTSTKLYVLKNTKSPALLVEVCFVDDKDDVTVYKKNVDKIAKKIAEGILNKEITSKQTTTTESAKEEYPGPTSPSGKYVKNAVDYALVFNPTFYASKYSDIKRAFGTDSTKLFDHFLTYGMKEGRQASSNFNPAVYKSTYQDLRNAFKDDMPKYYLHFIKYGYKEKRKSC